jgi:SAM-dependent methyltransferase
MPSESRDLMNQFLRAPAASLSQFDPSCRAAAERYVSANRNLKDRSSWGLRISATLNLFLWHLEAFASDQDPVPAFVTAFNRASALLETASKSGTIIDAFPPLSAEQAPDYEATVSGLFSDVWVEMTDDIYFEQSYAFTKERFEKSGFDPAQIFGGKVVLDAGCGSGKFSAALARLGARQVIGLDIGEKGLAFAREQAKKVPYGEKLDYRLGSTFDIPLPNESVDVVWSNGVIHHTLDYARCIAEFCRVLKPDGILFLHVNGCFGLYELLLDKLREATADIPRGLFLTFLKVLNVNAGRLYWIMDCLYAPYEWKSRDQVVALLEGHGFTDIKQMLRGVSIDPIEMVSQGLPYARVKYGDAQLKFLARKR